MNYPDNTFDAVCSSHVLEHIDKDFEFVEELIRIVKPGGKVVALVPARPSGSTDSRSWRANGHYRHWNFARVQFLERFLIDKAVVIEVSQVHVVHSFICPYIRFFEKAAMAPVFLLTKKRENEFLMIQSLNRWLLKILDAIDFKYRHGPQRVESNLVFQIVKRNSETTAYEIFNAAFLPS
jgi:SAM-dependent methyltransferase